MISAIGKAVTIAALCLALGLQWLALQSIAWTTMLVRNAQECSLSEALFRTFDGAHPCDFCHAVADGAKPEKDQQMIPVSFKPDLICATRRVVFPVDWSPCEYPEVHAELRVLLFPPPTPPPRQVLS